MMLTGGDFCKSWSTGATRKWTDSLVDLCSSDSGGATIINIVDIAFVEVGFL